MKVYKTSKENKVQYSTVSLPAPLVDSIKKKIKGTGINSVSAYVTFVLRQILSAPKQDIKITITKQEEQEIKERLGKLGYL